MRAARWLGIGCIWAIVPMLAAAAPPDFERDLVPLLNRSCVNCHGPEQQRGGLRLDSLAAILEGGNSGPAVIAGKSAESPLLQALTGAEDRAIMPPKGERFTADQVALVQTWIDGGAKGNLQPKSVAPKTPVRTTHWAFQPVKQQQPPAVKRFDWVRNPIDAFILAKLEANGIAPSPEADRITLIRRLSLDLRGLPPTIEEIQAFEQDSRPDAYERLVDQFLASPHYGERLARFWLDQARYADSHGYTIDGPRSIWKYRDWVIDSFNQDKPFDAFTIEQLAGDLLPQPTQQQLVATGFHRNTQINQEGGIDPEQFRVESVIDRVNTTGSVWLGLTVGCAQCHDHKFDPLSQREYYRLYAYFNQCDEPTLDLLTPAEQKRKREIAARMKVILPKLQTLDRTSPALVEKWERSQTDSSREQLHPAVRAVFEVAENGRSQEQKAFLENTFRSIDEFRQGMGILSSRNTLSATAQTSVLKTRIKLSRELASLKQNDPVAITTLIVRERKTPRENYIHLGGDFLRKGVAVQPGTPAVLPELSASPTQSRLELARWLVDGRNPLTGRVLANRIWGHLFGLGIVETENDFGTQGTPPSHPELLDWLAQTLIEERWSLKRFHRLLVTSATYRQRSNHRTDLVSIDPRNRLLARQSRHRLEAEIVRDVTLAASGLLSPKVGGPSVFPPQPDGVYRFTQVNKNWKASQGPDRYRRGMYTYFWRSAPHPALTTFDAPDASATCTRRIRSNTPLQALTLLNDQAFVETAHGLANRLLRDTAASDRDRLVLGFRLCVARTPTESELDTLQRFLSAQKQDLLNRPQEVAALLAGGNPVVIQSPLPESERAAWCQVARVLLNLDETITRE
ncbi:PSD1 and planctomycete cytochrome C domain-containing protein [Tuwongella immobilis]|uniref:Cytochrome c domain-containing protein n=1 Tax=Tuwongella immobilis TaxID=692036 RepID=A0A6C2YK42_9BACT|nr:PSD1 and planctomycete cytochrome C domain-containing protein [Tuwongella immobilis]VIP01950.1 probable chromosome segregation protein : Cytochrome c553 OS=Singulisphaera acidiphila (strain ATCC BAA-1392 / DSM 18658 / VKM B-2454 / MOB10) GN=Sinac_5109 PE=4 SV=1: PSCyt1: PSCyt2: PSD1 [Tuwongella immobilis]VTR99937.1 probable chromosome segregation protein : Cytochrome c553 OS=Singulisphaera acidiphila (strain ATCC BAA-1392 / DSM 18658 / VKM B-2454 / MOB10) GN=Sinac_5109 PE=4 SV=1: PSCyt1: PSCyt